MPLKFTFSNLPTIGWNDPTSRIVDIARRAEEVGCHRFGVSDWKFYQECFVTMTACLQATTTLEVESSVTEPYVRNPALTAAAIATMDDLSNGRAILGIGAGVESSSRVWTAPWGHERPRPVQAVREAIAAAEVRDGALVLDAGSGNGAFGLAWSERHRVVALDYSHSLLTDNPLPLRVEGTIFQLPFADGTFDLAFVGAMLHHVDDVLAALRELRRVSRGLVALVEPNRNNPAMFVFGAVVPEERGTLRFSARWLSEQVASAGMTVRSCVPIGWIPPNKIPAWSLPLFGRLPVRFPLGLHLLLIAQKDGR